jgi:hypothetical protein
MTRTVGLTATTTKKHTTIALTSHLMTNKHIVCAIKNRRTDTENKNSPGAAKWAVDRLLTRGGMLQLVHACQGYVY